jgi:hypothetical protein
MITFSYHPILSRSRGHRHISEWKCSKQPSKSNQFTSIKWDMENTHQINIRDRNMWIPPSKPGSSFPDSNWKMVIVHTIVTTSSWHHFRWDSARSWMWCTDHTRYHWGLKQPAGKCSVMWWLWWDEGRVLAHVKLPESDLWTRFKPELDQFGLCLVGIPGAWSKLNLMGAAMLPAPKSRTSSFWSSPSPLTNTSLHQWKICIANTQPKEEKGCRT